MPKRVITLDQLLQDDPPVIELGGVRFDGRQTSWPRAVRFETAIATQQYQQLIDLLRERAEDAEAVTDEWAETYLTLPMVEQFVAILYRGEVPDGLPSPTRKKRSTG